MKNKFIIISIIILFIGVIFRLALTQNNNFLFGIDSARDFVDVREMVELKKLRLTGPNTAINGLYNGPFWYYLLAVGYFFSQGDPYSAILMQIVLWVIGGYFLLKLVKSFNLFLVIPIGLLWVSSNYLVLTNLYSFNPTPVAMLSPLFIYLLVKYLEKSKAVYVILIWLLAGIFFNLEMNFGVFAPIIIILSVVFIEKKLLKQKWFWLGAGVFILTLLPQVIFDLKHQFIMSKAILRHLSENSDTNFYLLTRIQTISASFYNTFLPTLLNERLLVVGILIASLPIFLGFIKRKTKDKIVLVSLIFIVIPFLGYLFLPVTVNPWHLGGEMAVSLILVGYLLQKLFTSNCLGKITGSILTVSIIYFALFNIGKFFIYDRGKPSLDPTLFRNEIAAIDYVYQKAQGKNFKVYAYLPSVYDYSYQYLFWWYGQKKYGYVPGEYAYLPDRPKYIPGQDNFSGKKESFSGLVFLIKEPDRNYTRSGWEGELIELKSVGKEMVGPLEIETKKEF